MEYSFLGELQKYGYYTAKGYSEIGNDGWCYKFCYDFVANHDLEPEILKRINTDIPSKSSFSTVTPEMTKYETGLNKITSPNNIEMTTNKGRSMAA